jgi:hypothetical protein
MKKLLTAIFSVVLVSQIYAAVSVFKNPAGTSGTLTETFKIDGTHTIKNVSGTALGLVAFSDSASDLSTGTVPLGRLYSTAANYGINNGVALDALGNISTNGIITRTALNTYATRTITGTVGQVAVVNGDSIAGNPTLSLSNALTGINSVTSAASTDLTLNAGSGNKNINLVPSGTPGSGSEGNVKLLTPVWTSGASDGVYNWPMRWGNGNTYSLGGGFQNWAGIEDNLGGIYYNPAQVSGDVNFGLQFESRYIGSTEFFLSWQDAGHTLTTRPFQCNIDWGASYGGTTTGSTIWRFDVDEWNLYNRSNTALVAQFLLSATTNMSTFRFAGKVQSESYYATAQASTPASPVNGFRLYAASGDAFEWVDKHGYVTTLNTTGNTASRAYIFPNATGNVLVDSVPLVNPQVTGGVYVTSATGVLSLGGDTYFQRASVGDVSMLNSGTGFSVFRIQSSGSSQGAYLDLRPTNSAAAIIQRSGSTVLSFASNGDATTTGNLLTPLGKSVTVKSGTNALAGTVTLTAGVGTITSTAIDTNTVIVFSEKTAGGTPGLYQPLATVTSGSATVTSAVTDTSTYNWIAFKIN